MTAIEGKVRLTEAQRGVLRRLLDTGAMRASEALYEGGTSRTLAGLASKGLCRRHHFAAGVFYKPTPAGRAALSPEREGGA